MLAAIAARASAEIASRASISRARSALRQRATSAHSTGSPRCAARKSGCNSCMKQGGDAYWPDSSLSSSHRCVLHAPIVGHSTSHAGVDGRPKWRHAMPNRGVARIACRSLTLFRTGQFASLSSCETCWTGDLSRSCRTWTPPAFVLHEEKTMSEMFHPHVAPLLSCGLGRRRRAGDAASVFGARPGQPGASQDHGNDGPARPCVSL